MPWMWNTFPVFEYLTSSGQGSRPKPICGHRPTSCRKSMQQVASSLWESTPETRSGTASALAPQGPGISARRFQRLTEVAGQPVGNKP